MQVSEVRRRLLEKIDETASAGDEDEVAAVLSLARAALVALAEHPRDTEVTLQELTVGTKTAAVILGLHPEYVRHLVRRGRLQATKEHGELRIPLSHIGDFTMTGMRFLSREAELAAHVGDIMTGAKGSFVPWQSPDEAPDPEMPPE